jgi:hypothetical protein
MKRLNKAGMTRYEGKQFNKELELQNIKNMIVSVHKLAQEHDNFQFTGETAREPVRIYQALRDCESSLYDYLIAVERREYDGIIDMDRD